MRVINKVPLKRYFLRTSLGSVAKNLPANAGNTGLNPGLGRSHMSHSNEARAPQLLRPHPATTEALAARAHALQ